MIWLVKKWGGWYFSRLPQDGRDFAVKMIRNGFRQLILELMTAIVVVSGLLTTSTYPAVYTSFQAPPRSGPILRRAILEGSTYADIFRVANVISFLVSVLAIVSALMVTLSLHLHSRLSSQQDHEDDILRTWAAGCMYFMYMSAIQAFFWSIGFAVVAVIFASLSFDLFVTGWVQIAGIVVVIPLLTVVVVQLYVSKMDDSRYFQKQAKTEGLLETADIEYLFEELATPADIAFETVLLTLVMVAKIDLNKRSFTTEQVKHLLSVAWFHEKISLKSQILILELSAALMVVKVKHRAALNPQTAIRIWSRALSLGSRDLQVAALNTIVIVGEREGVAWWRPFRAAMDEFEDKLFDLLSVDGENAAKALALSIGSAKIALLPTLDRFQEVDDYPRKHVHVALMVKEGAELRESSL